MTKRTVNDVAKEAGLSTATVDRVLNERPGVSVATRRKVKQAALKLGYGQLSPEFMNNIRGRVSIIFVMPETNSGFGKTLVQQIKLMPTVLREVELSIEIRHLSSDDPKDWAAAIETASLENVDAIGVFSREGVQVQTAIDDAVAKGKKVVTFVSDVSPSKRHYYVGIDNIAAGRTAARLMGSFIGDKKAHVGVITCTLLGRDQIDRYLGFRELIQQEFKHLSVLPSVIAAENVSGDREIIAKMLRNYPNLQGIYVAGGESKTFADYVAADPTRNPRLVVHELTPQSRRGLLEGQINAVIRQDAKKIADCTVRALAAEVLGRPCPTSRRKINVEIILAENIP